MNSIHILAKEKVISLSELQKNPGKALNADIVRIIKHGKEIGIFLSKLEFEEMIEENLSLKKSFKEKLNQRIQESKKGKVVPLDDIF